MSQNPPEIGLEAARYTVRKAFGTEHLNLAVVTLGLARLGWSWEAVGKADGLYVGVAGLPEPEESGTIIAWTHVEQFDLFPALVRATAMAIESKWERL